MLTKEEEAARELLERLEEEKERRVEHLQRVAARRIGLGAVARGWSAWHAAWEERRRQRQMLASTARAAPAASSRRASRTGAGPGAARAEERVEGGGPCFGGAGAGSAAGLEAEVERLRAELEAERSGAAAQRRAAAEEAKEQAARQEEAAARQLIDRLEEEKEKRIAHLHQSAARPHGQPGDPSRLDGVG